MMMMMEFKGWTRQFWMALKPDPGQSTLRFETLDNGETVLEMVGTVDGRGVLLRWLNSDSGVVTVRATPYGSPEKHLDGELTPVSAEDDPALSAARARELVLAFA
jgi:hypothetical protein